MTDSSVHYYFYIHSIFGSFLKETLDFFSNYFYPRFEYSLVSTYDKAVHYIEKDIVNREQDKPNLPAIILNPTGEFGLADANAGGLQPWRFPGLAPNFAKRIFEPVYQDKNVIINTGFVRAKGELEFILLLNSFYEYTDIRMMILQFFNGMNKIVYPFYFNSFIIIPDELLNYTYNNNVTGENYNLDWTQFGSQDILVKTINQNKTTLPTKTQPIFKLTNISDGSTKYGGTDKLADWRLTFTLEYESEFPWFMIFESDYLAETMEITLNHNSVFSVNTEFNELPSKDRHIIKSEINQQVIYDPILGFDTTSSIPIVTDMGMQTFKNRYFYEVTQSDVDSTANIQISLQETILDESLIVLNSKYRKLNYGDDYFLTNSGNTIEVIKKNIIIDLNDIFELYVYEYI